MCGAGPTVGKGRLFPGCPVAWVRHRSLGPARMTMFKPAPDEEGVSDVVGSILLVGITVMVAVALGLMLLSFSGPTKEVHVELAVSLDPGSGGWGTGDERVRVRHLGGDALLMEPSRVLIVVGSQDYSRSGSALGSTWADGALSIGEMWEAQMNIPANAPVRVGVVGGGVGEPTLVSSQNLVASASTATNPCATDTQAPSVLQWSQNPSAVTGLTVGGVTVTAQLGDNCYGANPGVVPSLYWRVTPASAFTNQGPMTTAGTNRWTASIPAQNWASAVGQRLEYYIGPLTDLGGNSANSATVSNLIPANCSADVTAPTATSLTQAPVDVRSTTLGAVTVTVVVADDCSGVNTASPPRLYYRISTGTGSFVDGGAMVLQSGTTWQGTVPDPLWATQAGRTLEYYVGGMQDLNGNVGVSTTRSDLVDVVSTHTFVTSNTPVRGVVASFSNAQSATDLGAEASIAEASVAGSPSTQALNPNLVVSALGWSGASVTNLQASDGLRGTYGLSNPSSANVLRVGFQDPSVSAATVSKVVVYAELSIINDPNDQFQLQVCFTLGLCSAAGTGLSPPTPGASYTGTSSDVVVGYDVTGLRPGGGSWSNADLANVEGVVHLIQQGGNSGSWRVNRIWLEATSAFNTFDANVELSWTGVPAGATQTLDLRYRTTGDTFNVQVCQDATVPCGTWATRGTALSAAGATSWTYVLTAAEYNSGAPRIRIVDVTPAGNTQGYLYLDYARVATT